MSVCKAWMNVVLIPHPVSQICRSSRVASVKITSFASITCFVPLTGCVPVHWCPEVVSSVSVFCPLGIKVEPPETSPIHCIKEEKNKNVWPGWYVTLPTWHYFSLLSFQFGRATELQFSLFQSAWGGDSLGMISSECVPVCCCSSYNTTRILNDKTEKKRCTWWSRVAFISHFHIVQ